MNEFAITSANLGILAALANGIIPADERDAGAASVDAASIIAARLNGGPGAGSYVKALNAANDLAQSTFGLAIKDLNPIQVHQLLETLLESSPAFFRQLRADVCGIYLSNPTVWERIGFPGASTEAGGYPDFDQAQF
jgi:hypothetical protein